MTPDGGQIHLQPGLTSQQAGYEIVNNATTAQTYSLSCSATGSVSCVSVSPSQITMDANEIGEATVTYNSGGVGTGVLALHATGATSDSGYYAATVANPTPSVFTALLNGSYLTSGACVAACFDFVYAHATPAFYTMNAARRFGVIYNSSTAKPTPVVMA